MTTEKETKRSAPRARGVDPLLDALDTAVDKARARAAAPTRRTPRTRGSGGIFKPKGSRFWWIAYVVNGKRQFESSKSEKKSDAVELLNERLGLAQKGVKVSKKLGRITIAQALKVVIDDMALSDRTSVEGVQRQIDLHILKHQATDDREAGGFFHPDRLMSNIATSDLLEYVASRREENASIATCRNELATIRRAFKLGLKHGNLATIPHVPMPTVNNVRTGFFEADQITAVIAALPKPLRHVIEFGYLTGWRVKSEVLPLQWSHVDRAAKVITIPPGVTKNREGRTLPYELLPQLVTIIDTQWREHKRLQKAGVIAPFVFTRNGKQIRDFITAWRTACTTAGYPGMLVHDLRRTAVRNLVRAGVPEKVSMQVTGHKTRSVFDRYDITTGNDVRVALGQLAQPSHVPEAKRRGRVAQFQKSRVKDQLKSA